MYEFDYHHPGTLDGAKDIHAKGEDSRYLAGGMTLIPVLKQRLDRPSDVVDLASIDDLKGIREDGGAIVIGAMSTHHEVHASDLVKARIPALAHLAGGIGDPMVRNRGTIGGSLANNDPAADYPAAVLALDATIITDRRKVAADDFFVAMFETALEPGEMITAVSFRVADRAGYQKFPNPASRFPIVGVFAALFGAAARIGVTGAGPSAFRMPEMEDALAKGWEASNLEGITIADDGLNADIHASAEYRAHLVGVMARRAVAAA